MKKKMIKITASVFAISLSLQSLIGGIEVFADEVNSARQDFLNPDIYAVQETEKNKVYDDIVQIKDSSGKGIDGVKVEITAVIDGKMIIKTETSRTDMEELYEKEGMITVGWELPVSWIDIDIYDGEAEYVLHFTEVPDGYELPQDIRFFCDTKKKDNSTSLISIPDTTAEIAFMGLDTVNIPIENESVGETGWMQDDEPQPNDNQRYYCGRDGKRYKGWHYMTEKEGVAPAAWMYFSEGNGWIYTGWNMMSVQEGEKIPHWSYFGDDGKLRIGWQRLGEGTGNPNGEAAAHWSYFGPNGWLRTNWQQLGQGTSNPDGNAERHWSYFGSDGWLRTNWQQMGKGTSNPDGNSEKHWSYFGPNGWLRTNWQQLGKGTSNPDGNAEKHWSYFGPNGWLRTGWQQLGKGTNNPDGEAEAHWSYFGNNGWLNIGERMIEGKKYIFGDDGWLR